jgi:hypothetical protein
MDWSLAAIGAFKAADHSWITADQDYLHARVAILGEPKGNRTGQRCRRPSDC